MRVVVTGAEASGTRLMAGILKKSRQLEVEHRSMPYEGGPQRHWPTDRNFDGMPDHLVIMSRDAGVTIKSQINVGHVASHVEANCNIAETWLRLFTWIMENQVPFSIVNYEALVLHPATTVRYIASRLRVELAAPQDIYNGNEKHCDPGDCVESPLLSPESDSNGARGRRSPASLKTPQNATQASNMSSSTGSRGVSDYSR